MRRRIATLLAGLTIACGERATPRIGVVVSRVPREASAIAVADIGRSGARPIELVTSDDPGANAAEGSLALAQSLAADATLLAVVGHSSSSVSLAASQIYNAAGIVQLAPTTTAPAYSDAGPFSFRMVPSDVEQARFIADAIRASWAGRRTAVVYVNDDYGRGLYRELLPLLDRPAFIGMYAEAPDSLHISQLAERLRAEAPDVLVWLGRPRRLALTLAALRPEMPELYVLCGDACDDAVLYSNADGAFTGVRFVRFVDPDLPNERLRAFRSAYETRTGQPVAVEAILTYDAVRLLAEAIAGGAHSRDQLRRYLLSLGRERPAFDGISGPVRFSPSGDAQRPYLLADVSRHGVGPAVTGH